MIARVQEAYCNMLVKYREELTRPIDVRHPTVERADKLAQRGNDAVHCGHTTLWLIAHPVG